MTVPFNLIEVKSLKNNHFEVFFFVKANFVGISEVLKLTPFLLFMLLLG